MTFNLKSTIFIGVVLNVSILAMASFDGGGSGHVGGGGVAVVCRDSNKKIISAEMLDVFEGRNVYKLDIPNQESRDPNDVVATDINKLRLHPLYQSKLSEALQSFSSNLRVMDPGVRNLSTNDAFPLITKDGCGFEQAAVYNDELEVVMVDQEVFGAFNNLNKAALYLHEAVYKIDREYIVNEKTSLYARKLTAYLLANTEDLHTITQQIRWLPLIVFPSNVSFHPDPIMASTDLSKTCLIGIYMAPVGDQFIVFTDDVHRSYCEPARLKCFGTYVQDDWRILTDFDHTSKWHSTLDSSCKLLLEDPLTFDVINGTTDYSYTAWAP